MKIRNKCFLSGLLVVTASVIPSANAATLLVGWYDFPNGKGDVPANLAAGGFTGVARAEFTRDLGGSSNPTLGSSLIPVPDSSPLGDGAAIVRTATYDQPAFFSVTNNSGQNQPLQDLLFDAASGNIETTIDISFQVGSSFDPNGPFTPLQSIGVSTFLSPLVTYDSYSDYSISLGGLELGNGQTATFRFLVGGPVTRTAAIDNVGITAIPEPASHLILAFVGMFGLLSRKR